MVLWSPPRADRLGGMTGTSRILFAVFPIIAACAPLDRGDDRPGRDDGATSVQPEARVAPPPRRGANTVDALDTATEEQRAAATAPATAEGERLGEVTASLGDPTDPGIWMRTGLVESRQSGRVVVEGSGAGATVELIPLEGEGGAQLSLSAMRLLNVALTDLPTVIVYRQ